MDVTRDVRIENGATLTIKSDVYMPLRTRIIIEPGAELILDGGRITNRCQPMWRGIEVRGIKSRHQMNGAQGKFVMKNGGRLENMEYGVSNHGYGPQGIMIWNSTGGIIQIQDGYFYNNKRDIGFMPYRNIAGVELPNESYIEDAEFWIDEYFFLKKGDKPHFISSWRNNGIKINGNEFRDDRKEGFDFTGINVIQGSIEVSPHCPTCPTRNLFKGLKYGIRLKSNYPGTQFYSSIYLNDFVDNWGGIYVASTQFTEVHSNNLKVPGSPIEVDLNQIPYGIYMEGCDLFVCENNHIERSIDGTNMTVPNTDEACVGIVHNNSAISEETVYRNNIEGMFIGVEAIGENRSSSSNKGLVYSCNDFSFGRYDIYLTDVVGPGGSSNPGIKSSQGNDNEGALNNFSYELASEYSVSRKFEDLESSLKVVHDYWYHQSVSMATDRYEPGYRDALDLNSNTWDAFMNPSDPPPGSCDLTIDFNGLNSEHGNTTSFTQTQRLEMASADFQKLIYENTLNQLEDGGNTSLLESELDQVTITNSYNLYTTLLQESPYISQEILEELIGKEYEFPEALLRDVLVLNHQTLKENGTYEALDGRISTLPDYMMDQIYAAAESGLTSSEILRQNIAREESKKRTAFRRAYKAMVKDTSGTYTTDSIAQLVSNYPSLSGELLEIEAALLDNDLATINALQLSLTNNERTEKAQEIDLLIDVVKGYSTDSSFSNLNEADMSSLESLSTRHGVAGGRARAILEVNQNEDFEYHEPVLLPESELVPKSMRTEFEPMSELSVFPNPAKDYTVIKYRVTPNKGMDYALLIFDMEGKMVYDQKLGYSEDQVTVITEKLSSGSYIAVIKSGGEVEESKQFVIQK